MRPFHRFFLVPALSALVALAAAAPQASPLAAQEERVALRLSPEVGETDTYRFEQDLDIDLPPEFGGSQAAHFVLVLRQTAQDVSGDTLSLLSEVEDVAVDVSGQQQGLDFSRFEGQRFRARVTRRGEIVSLEPEGEAAAGVDDVRESIRQVGFPVLPPAPVAIGDAWTDTTRVEAGAMGVPASGDIVSVNRTTLERLSEEDGRRIAHLTVRTRFGFEPRGAGMAGMSVQISGSARDTVRFDVTEGRFLDAGGRQQFVMEMALPGTAASMQVRATGERQAKLLP